MDSLPFLPTFFQQLPPHGAAVDHIRQFAKDNGYKVEWLTAVPFPRLMAMLKEGQIDMAPLIRKTKEREEFLLYPNDYLFESKPTLISYTFLGTDNWVENGIALLNKKCVDGILSLNQYTISYEIKNKGLAQQFTAIPLPTLDESDLTYLALSKKSKNSTNLLELLNKWNPTHPYEAAINPYINESSN